ncbi:MULTISPECIES: hypothetical protein [Rhizobium]|uniref:Uncharacterized protein n=1 Tax=Rhizobium leguminosarum TaxID=384 RepID=A0A7X0DUP8_RHILE|nr:MULTISPECIES: hypothetical protein [Rhizobium]KPH09221.1 hypothetical protein AOG23_08080 [Rhizobium acidisoli]MBB6223706.1 hypothetical protein [Rhizobium leguminosarum]
MEYFATGHYWEFGPPAGNFYLIAFCGIGIPNAGHAVIPRFRLDFRAAFLFTAPNPRRAA